MRGLLASISFLWEPLKLSYPGVHMWTCPIGGDDPHVLIGWVYQSLLLHVICVLGIAPRLCFEVCRWVPLAERPSQRSVSPDVWGGWVQSRASEMGRRLLESHIEKTLLLITLLRTSRTNKRKDKIQNRAKGLKKKTRAKWAKCIKSKVWI